MATIDQEITLLTTELLDALAAWRYANLNSGRADYEWRRTDVLTIATALTALRQPAAQTGDDR
jgi:hypothetical protein